MGWRIVRDWEVVEEVSSLGKDSYDMIGRRVSFGNGEFDLMRYRSENYQIEARFYYGEGRERSEALENLKTARERLEQEGFRPILQLKDSEVLKPGYKPELQGNYFLDSEAEFSEIEGALDGLIEDRLRDLSEIKCK